MPIVKHQNILLVDDEQDILTTMKMFLKGEGVEVQTAINAYDALEIIRSSSVDLVITDLKMPGMDGVQLLQMIKERDDGIPVIVMTGHSDSSDAQALVTAYRVAGFLSKPFENIEHLLTMITDALDKRNETAARSNTRHPDFLP